jgi:hypothetical protein
MVPAILEIRQHHMIYSASPLAVMVPAILEIRQHHIIYLSQVIPIAGVWTSFSRHSSEQVLLAK